MMNPGHKKFFECKTNSLSSKMHKKVSQNLKYSLQLSSLIGTIRKMRV